MIKHNRKNMTLIKYYQIMKKQKIYNNLISMKKNFVLQLNNLNNLKNSVNMFNNSVI